MKVSITFEVEPDNYASDTEMLAAIKGTYADHRLYKFPISIIPEDEHRGAYTEIFMKEGTVEIKQVSRLPKLPPTPYDEALDELACLLTDDWCDENDHAAKARLFIAEQLAEAASDIVEAAQETALQLRKEAIKRIKGD